MNGYYAYQVDERGLVQKRFDLYCENDAQAKERAKQLVDSHAIELWKDGRRIAEFNPDN